MEFKDIYTRYWQKVFRLCMGYVNDADWAQDIAQDTFVVVWKSLKSFRQESSVGTWIYRIAVNHCLRQIGKDRKLQRIDMRMDVPIPDCTSMESNMQFLYRCIAELPEIERIIISLELEEIKQKEISRIVGISEENVRVKIHRIKVKLTKRFKNYEH